MVDYRFRFLVGKIRFSIIVVCYLDSSKAGQDRTDFELIWRGFDPHQHYTWVGHGLCGGKT